MTTELARRADGIYDSGKFHTAQRPWIGELPPVKGDYTFAVLGDRCGLAIPGVFERAAELIKRLKPDFAIGVGDLVEGYTDDEAAARAEWERMEDVLRGMDVPFFPTVGNHDYGTETMIRVYRERRGFEYYAIRYGRSLFLFLNTEEIPKTMGPAESEGFRQLVGLMSVDPAKAEAIIHAHYAKAAEAALSGEPAAAGEHDLDLLRNAVSDEQLAFFEKVLAEHADAEWTFVCLHVPAWKTKNEPFARLEEMLAGRNHTFFAGHLHMLELHRDERGDRIQMGRTGAVRHGRGTGDADHILWVSVQDGKPSFTVIELDGARDLAEYEV